MADGGGGISTNFAYIPPTGMVRPSDMKGGACTPDMRDVRERLVPWRFATGYQQVTRNAVSGSLEIAAGSTLLLFDKGYGESGSGCGYTGELTESDTNAIRNGGVVPNTGQWLTLGWLFGIGKPFTVQAGVTNWTTKRYDANLIGPDGYAAQVVKAWLDNLNLEIEHTGNACRYNLGNVGLWGEVSGMLDAAISTRIAGQFWYAAASDHSMGANIDGALQCRLNTDYGVEVQQSGLNPTTANRDVIIPLHVMALGVPYCPGDEKK